MGGANSTTMIEDHVDTSIALEARECAADVSELRSDDSYSSTHCDDVDSDCSIKYEDLKTTPPEERGYPGYAEQDLQPSIDALASKIVEDVQNGTTRNIPRILGDAKRCGYEVDEDAVWAAILDFNRTSDYEWDYAVLTNCPVVQREDSYKPSKSSSAEEEVAAIMDAFRKNDVLTMESFLPWDVSSLQSPNLSRARYCFLDPTSSPRSVSSAGLSVNTRTLIAKILNELRSPIFNSSFLSPPLGFSASPPCSPLKKIALLCPTKKHYYTMAFETPNKEAADID